tara:strand:- start:23308 stop:24165 length:858 start_codon:yes stop_codon:yes gene_type:complete
MNIAIIGTSPIMIILANQLSKNNNITIFEKSKNYGGAWALEKYKSEYTNGKTNVVIPRNKREEKFVIKMNKFLEKKFNIIAKVNNQFFSDSGIYKPKKIFIYDFKNLFLDLNKKFDIKKDIKKIEVNKNKVIINNKDYFDKIYIPYNAGIDKINILNTVRKIDFSKIISKHILIITKKKVLKNFYYTEDFDNVFDRVLISNKKKFYSFTARIRKNYKKFSLKILLKKTKINLKGNKIYLTKILKYQNHYRGPEQIKELLKLKNNKKISIVDTRQFVKSLISLRVC